MKADSERRMLNIQDSLSHIEPGRGVRLNQAGRASGKREQQTNLKHKARQRGEGKGFQVGASAGQSCRGGNEWAPSWGEEGS